MYIIKGQRSMVNGSGLVNGQKDGGSGSSSSGSGR